MKKKTLTILLMLAFTAVAHAGHQGGGDQKCSNCHSANLINEHGGFGSEGAYCLRCHDSTNTQVVATIAKGIQGLPVKCADCHGGASHGEKHISAYFPDWRSFWGVEPAATSMWSQPANYTALDPAAKQYQLCFRCHSSYSFGQVPKGVTSLTTSSGTPLTDQAMEFNTANKSAHPIRATLNGQTGSYTPRALNSARMKSPWSSSVGNQTMNCSDCHGSTASGSISGGMLAGWEWPRASRKSNELWTLADVRNNRHSWNTSLLCAKCHTLFSGGKFLNNVHDKGDHTGEAEFNDAPYRTLYTQGVPCVSCHTAIPHGSPRSRLIVYNSDPEPYTIRDFKKNNVNPAVVREFKKASSPTNYSKSNCYIPSGAGCDDHNSRVSSPD